MTALKPQILEVVEKAREEEVVQRKAKKKAEDEEKEKEKKRLAELKAKADEQKASESASEASETTTTTTVTPAAPQEAMASSTPNDSMSEAHSRMAEDFALAISSHLSRGTLGSLQATGADAAEEILLSAPAAPDQPNRVQDDNLPPPPPPPFPTLDLPNSNDSLRLYLTDEDETEAENRLPAALAPLSPSPEQSAQASVQDRDVVMRSENTSPTREVTSVEAAEATAEAAVETPEVEVPPISAVTNSSAPASAAQGESDPGAGPSGKLWFLFTFLTLFCLHIEIVLQF